jgi:hypothetical protein
MITRRSFLLGAGGLLTTAFVTRVQRHVQETARPLLVDPGSADETLYLYDQQSWSDHNKWRLSLGPYGGETEPPSPTWREHLIARGFRLESADKVAVVCHEMSLGPDQLDEPVPEWTWADYWEHSGNPEAQAYWLLKELRLDVPFGKHEPTAGRIEFLDSPNPCSSWPWVELRDDLSASLLQARLVELGQPIRLQIA